MDSRRNPVGIDFLRTESETAFLFARIASDANDEEKKRRNVRNARTAYDTLLHFVNQLALTEDEQDEIRVNLTELHRQLLVLGETF